jgi:hypothetical protein
VILSIVHLWHILFRIGKLTKFRSLSVVQAKKKGSGYTVSLDLALANERVFVKFFSAVESKSYEQHLYESPLLSDLRNKGPVSTPEVIFSSKKMVASKKFEGVPLIDLFRYCEQDSSYDEIVCRVHEHIGNWLGKIHTSEVSGKTISGPLKLESKFPQVNQVINSMDARGVGHRGFSHGDFSYHQILISEDFRSVFICDFEDFYSGPTCIDLATYFSKLQLLSKDSPFFSPALESRCRASFFSGYCSHMSVGSREIELVARLEGVLIQRYHQNRGD